MFASRRIKLEVKMALANGKKRLLADRKRGNKAERQDAIGFRISVFIITNVDILGKPN
jgi:hypothetical protein